MPARRGRSRARNRRAECSVPTTNSSIARYMASMSASTLMRRILARSPRLMARHAMRRNLGQCLAVVEKIAKRLPVRLPFVLFSTGAGSAFAASASAALSACGSAGGCSGCLWPRLSARVLTRRPVSSRIVRSRPRRSARSLMISARMCPTPSSTSPILCICRSGLTKSAARASRSRQAGSAARISSASGSKPAAARRRGQRLLLGLVRKIEIFQPLHRVGGFDQRGQLGRGFALRFDRTQDRLLAVCQLTQLEHALLDGANLLLVHPTRLILAIAGDEGDGIAAVKQVDDGGDAVQRQRSVARPPGRDRDRSIEIMQLYMPLASQENFNARFLRLRPYSLRNLETAQRFVSSRQPSTSSPKLPASRRYTAHARAFCIAQDSDRCHAGAGKKTNFLPNRSNPENARGRYMHHVTRVGASGARGVLARSTSGDSGASRRSSQGSAT